MKNARKGKNDSIIIWYDIIDRLKEWRRIGCFVITGETDIYESLKQDWKSSNYSKLLNVIIKEPLEGESRQGFFWLL